MSPRRAVVVAWVLAGVFFAMATSAVALALRDDAPPDYGLVVLVAGWAVVGAAVAAREPRNAVGWLMLGIALAFGVQGLVDLYLTAPGRPGEAWVAWVSAWIWYVWLYSACLFLPLVFPDGRLLSRRWRVAAWLGAVALALAILGAALAPGSLDTESSQVVQNPLAVGGEFATAVSVSRIAGDLLAAVGVVLGAVCLILRLRRAKGRERQQVKWFAYVGALALGGLLVAIVSLYGEQAEGEPRQWALVIGTIGWSSALLLLLIGIPAAVGIGILRHRLYDIDVVIKRTVVYGSLTVLLLAAYLTLVLTLRQLLSPVTGTSDLAVAISTLAVAGLFRPLRSRIQEAVDRRFYRSRYDAARAVELFSGQLRQELDLSAVRADLQAVVADTMKPAHVSVWLRDPGGVR